MFDKLCARLCLHTRAARIAFFSSLFFIVSVTTLAALYLYEPQAMVPPPAVQNFEPQSLAEAFRDEFGQEQGDRLFTLVRSQAASGDAVLRQFVLLRREESDGRILTAEAAKDVIAADQRQWADQAPQLLSADTPLIRSVAQDIDEAQQLSVDGLSRLNPLFNKRLHRARSMFHDLNRVLLAEEKSNQYYGDTRLGRLIEKGQL